MKKPNSIAGSDILLFYIVFLILYSFFYFFKPPRPRKLAFWAEIL